MRFSIPLTAVGLIAVLATGCSTAASQQSEAPSTPASSSSPPASTAPIPLSAPIEHIHGAAIDPGTGALYVGTHHGIWAITDTGEVTRQGTADDDFMGFTITDGPWYASGHPGPGNRAPNPLGLIQSTDRGLTWSAISRSGQSDFHALTATRQTIVGYDGGPALLVSTDSGRTWSKGADIQPMALAFSRNRLLASTGSGLAASTDTGQTFTPIQGAPAAVLLSATASVVWCIDRQGAAWRSTDAGSTWTRKGPVGQVQAIAAVSADTAWAITQTELIKLG